MRLEQKNSVWSQLGRHGHYFPSAIVSQACDELVCHTFLETASQQGPVDANTFATVIRDLYPKMPMSEVTETTALALSTASTPEFVQRLG